MAEQGNDQETEDLASYLKDLGLEDNAGGIFQRLTRFPASDIFKSHSIYKFSLVFAASASQWKFIRQLAIAGLTTNNADESLVKALENCDFNGVRRYVTEHKDAEILKAMPGYDFITSLVLYGCPADCMEFVMDQLEQVNGCGHLNGFDFHGFTPLISAVIGGNLDCVQSLLDRGARVDMIYDKFLGIDKYGHEVGVCFTQGKLSFKEGIFYGQSKTALMYAVCLGNIECVKMLLKYKPEMKRECLRKMNALSYAAVTGNVDCLDLLLKAPMEIDKSEKMGKLALSSGSNNGVTDGFKFNFSSDFNFGAISTEKTEEVKSVADSADQVTQDKISRRPKLKARFKGDRKRPKNAGNGSENGEDTQGMRKGIRMDDCNKPQYNVRPFAESALPYGVIGGDVQCVESLLNCCGNLNCTDALGKNALLLAAEEGKADIVKLLLKNWATVDKRLLGNSSGPTPLMNACQNGMTDCVKILLEHKANIEAENEHWRTPLFLAVLAGKTECVELLLQFGAVIHKKDRNGKSVLQLAAEAGSSSCLEILLKMFVDRGESQSQRDLGHTRDSDPTGVDTVHESSPDDSNAKKVKNTSNEQEGTAVEKTDQEQKDETAKPPNTWTLQVLAEESLPSAIIGGDMKCVDLLLPHCGNLDRKGAMGKSALMLAVELGKMDVVKLLLENKADVNVTSDEGDCALICATRKGKKDCLELLLKHGANPSIMNKYGKTAMIATRSGEDGCLDLLLKHGAFGQMDSKQLLTLVTAAICMKDNRCLKVLTKAGGPVNICDFYGTKGFERFLDYPDNLRFLLENGLLYMKRDLNAATTAAYKLDGMPAINSKKRFKAVQLLLQYQVFDWSVWCDDQNIVNILPAALQAGVFPGSVYEEEELVSPIQLAYLNTSESVVKFLLSNLYFSLDDYRTFVDSSFVEKFNSNRNSVTLLSLFKQVTRHPWNLQTLCLLTISTSLFENKSNMGRRKQVDSLPIPDKFKTVLKFQGVHSRLCVDDWNTIGNPPGSDQTYNVMYPSKFVYPQAHVLKDCVKGCNMCWGTGQTIIESDDEDDDQSDDK